MIRNWGWGVMAMASRGAKKTERPRTCTESIQKQPTDHRPHFFPDLFFVVVFPGASQQVEFKFKNTKTLFEKRSMPKMFY
jgi:hypothetical protein